MAPAPIILSSKYCIIKVERMWSIPEEYFSYIPKISAPAAAISTKAEYTVYITGYKRTFTDSTFLCLYRICRRKTLTFGCYLK